MGAVFPVITGLKAMESDFPFGGLGGFGRTCLVFPFLSDFDERQTFLQWFSFPQTPHFEP